MRKHAYLIMAHNEPEILYKLLKLLDDKRNDLFVHIDKKSKEFDLDRFRNCVEKSNIYFINRKDIRWGNYSQIECELDLLKEATNNGKYEYYHLISGVDFPLKNQDEIHNFFDKNKGLEFVHFCNTHPVTGNIFNRVNYYHLFAKWLRSDSKIKLKISSFLHSGIIKIQKIFHIQRYKNKEFYYGANWFSITDSLARYVLENKSKIKKTYRHTLCADELFLQTLLVSSPYYKNLYNFSDDGNYNQIMRYIDWTRGGPYTFRSSDYDELINSNMLFARKFSCKVDGAIIDKLYDKLRADKNDKS